MLITSKQREMLECAVADAGDITRAASGQSGWHANGKKFAEVTGETLFRGKLIDRVKMSDSANTARRGMGYHYRVTDAGRAALAVYT